MKRNIHSVELTHPDAGSTRVPPSSVRAFQRLGWEPKGEPETLASVQPVSIGCPAGTSEELAVTAATTNRPTAPAAGEHVPQGTNDPEEG